MSSTAFGIVPGNLDVVLRYYLPKSTRWWLQRLLRIGQGTGADLLYSDLDMPCSDNVASVDKVLATLEHEGLIRRAGYMPDRSTLAFLSLERGRSRAYAYPREHIYVPANRERIEAILADGATQAEVSR